MRVCGAHPSDCLQTFLADQLPPYVRPPAEVVRAMDAVVPAPPMPAPETVSLLKLEANDLRWTPTYELRLVLAVEARCGGLTDALAVAACRAELLRSARVKLPPLPDATPDGGP